MTLGALYGRLMLTQVFQLHWPDMCILPWFFVHLTTSPVGVSPSAESVEISNHVLGLNVRPGMHAPLCGKPDIMTRSRRVPNEIPALTEKRETIPTL